MNIKKLYKNRYKIKLIKFDVSKLVSNYKNLTLCHFKCLFKFPLIKIFNYEIKNLDICLDFIFEYDKNYTYDKVITTFLNYKNKIIKTYKDKQYLIALQSYLVNEILSKN